MGFFLCEVHIDKLLLAQSAFSFIVFSSARYIQFQHLDVSMLKSFKVIFQDGIADFLQELLYHSV